MKIQKQNAWTIVCLILMLIIIVAFVFIPYEEEIVYQNNGHPFDLAYSALLAPFYHVAYLRKDGFDSSWFVKETLPTCLRYVILIFWIYAIVDLVSSRDQKKFIINSCKTFICSSVVSVVFMIRVARSFLNDDFTDASYWDYIFSSPGFIVIFITSIVGIIIFYYYKSLKPENNTTLSLIQIDHSVYEPDQIVHSNINTNEWNLLLIGEGVFIDVSDMQDDEIIDEIGCVFRKVNNNIPAVQSFIHNVRLNDENLTAGEFYQLVTGDKLAIDDKVFTIYIEYKE